MFLETRIIYLFFYSYLQSHGATEENNVELAQISYQLKLMQSHTVFSQNQLTALKYQIMAYKLLSKDTPLPLNLQQAVLAPFNGLSAESPTTPTVKPATTSTIKKITKPQSPLRSIPQTKIPARPAYNAYVLPSQLLPKPISSYVHSSRQQRLLVPSLTPVGLDTCHIISQREERILARIQNQIEELNHNDVKQIIKVRALKLREKQQKLRNELVSGVSKSTVLSTSLDRTTYRRMKKITLKESRHVESMERQQRSNRDQTLRQAQQKRLNEICEHGLHLVAHHKNNESKLSKLGRTVVQYHHHIEKEEQKRVERIAKERILALKNDDEEAYLKLLDEAKDTRLTHLLKQTGQFLESLTKSVVDQQNDSKNMRSKLDIQMEDDEESDPQAVSSADYYHITHRVREEVCQPNIMVGGKLKDYQVKGLQWMVSLYNNNLNGILADEMGLGKTIQTISLITYLIEMKRQNGPFLIIVPLSTLTNWTLEFDKWAPSVSKVIYKGNPLARRNLAGVVRSGNFQVLLTTFEYIIRDRAVLSRVKWLHLIMDEGHRMKNSNSKLNVCLRQSYKTRYRLILTGTPLQNNLPELWALLNFILPKIFKSVKSFEEWFNTPFSNQGVQDKVDLNEEEQLLIIKRLHKVLRPFLLRRLKKDVESELPDKVEHVVKCKLSTLQQKIYQQLKKNNSLCINNDSAASAKGLNNTIMQLRKVCNHPFVFEGVETTLNPSGKSNELLYRSCGKFELLDRMLPKLRNTGHRVLIFFQMTRIMSIMEDYLNWRSFPYLRLDGSTKSDDRSSLLHLFNQPDSPYFIFLLSTRAGGLGLNLQTADTVIIFDSDWNPHQDLQAQDRAHRIGQTKEVRIFRLVTSNSIEESILARANYKLDIDGKVIQAGKFDNRSTEEDREAFLRTLLEDKVDDEDEPDEEANEDEELNEMLQRSDEELSIFRRMDLERERTENEMYRRRGYSKRLDRLIQEDELPDILTQENQLVIQPDSVIDFGRGRRARDEVRYDDGLTEEEWLDAIEKEEEEAEIEMNRSRRRGAPANQPKKRGPVNNPEERNKNYDILLPEIRQQLTRVFDACYKAVEGATVEEEAEEEDDQDEIIYRQRCELFMDLVSKKEYPIYYTLIKNPISMNIIKKRIHSNHYDSVLQFEQDFNLMFDNARTFNEEGSYVYEDADEMQKIFEKELERQCPGGALPNLFHRRNM
ncbi:hypothetical protein INT48_008591, partial [Thamnidium elegans]